MLLVAELLDCSFKGDRKKNLRLVALAARGLPNAPDQRYRHIPHFISKTENRPFEPKY